MTDPRAFDDAESDADVSRLLRLAGPRPDPPADVAARVHASALGAWQDTWRARRRRNWLASAGLAAVLALAFVRTATFLPEGRDLAGFLDQQGHLDDGAESTAAHTGGLTLRSDLAEAWRRVADESRVYYLLGCQSTNPSRDGRLRRIEIEVARPGARVRARPGHYAPCETDRAADPAREALDMAASSMRHLHRALVPALCLGTLSAGSAGRGRRAGALPAPRLPRLVRRAPERGRGRLGRSPAQAQG
jgi:hypothetical protein